MVFSCSLDNYIDQDDHDYETDVSSVVSSNRGTPTPGKRSKFLTVQPNRVRVCACVRRREFVCVCVMRLCVCVCACIRRVG